MDPVQTVRFSSSQVPRSSSCPALNMEKIRMEIVHELELLGFQAGASRSLASSALVSNSNEWLKTGVPGFDDLLYHGIPRGTSILVCGGPGSGKTLFCLQSLYHGALAGERCLYMTFEESPDRLVRHMADFGWNARPLIEQGKLMIMRFNPFDITRQVEAMLEAAKGELLIDIQPLIFPPEFRPQRIVVDSLSAIAAAFGREETYRIYVEQLFRFFEKVGATSFLISESSDLSRKLTTAGVEEFLADGVFVLYNLRHGNIRESAIEILKLRGADFKKKLVAMRILAGIGVVVYPHQEIFNNLDVHP